MYKWLVTLCKGEYYPSKANSGVVLVDRHDMRVIALSCLEATEAAKQVYPGFYVYGCTKMGTKQ